jgi:hypothetical protein
MAKFKKVSKPYRAICFRAGRAERFEYFTDHATAVERARLASFDWDYTMVECWTGQQWVLSVSPPAGAASNQDTTGLRLKAHGVRR